MGFFMGIRQLGKWNKALAILVAALLALAPSVMAKDKDGDDKDSGHHNSAKNGPTKFFSINQALGRSDDDFGKDSKKSVVELIEDKADFIVQSVRLVAGRSNNGLYPRGDPKTNYDQSENRLHSAVQRARLLPPPPPPPPPSEPPPPPPPSYLVDLYNWVVSQQTQSSSGWQTLYTPTSSSDYDAILVVYDTTTLEPTSITGYITELVTTFPSLEGTLLVFKTTAPDGSVVELYGFVTADMTSIADVTDWIEVRYDAAGQFVDATIRTAESLPLDSINIPSLTL